MKYGVYVVYLLNFFFFTSFMLLFMNMTPLTPTQFAPFFRLFDSHFSCIALCHHGIIQ